MQLAFITPTRYLKKFAAQGDIYLALAHLIEEDPDSGWINEYGRFHRNEAQKGRRVILDNGLFEQSQVTNELLLRRAELIQADTVCAPDVLYNCDETIKAFKQFIKAKRDYGLVTRVMGIPQADNPNDWWHCFRFMELSSDCDIIGLSILSVPKSFEGFVHKAGQPGITSSRVYLLRQLSYYCTVLGRPLKPIHLLGLGESYGDIITAKRLLPHTVVSNDSSSAFIHGKHGISYSKLGTWGTGKNDEKVDFNQEELPYEAEETIQHNIDTAKYIARLHF